MSNNQQTGLILKVIHLQEESDHIITQVLTNVIEYEYDPTDQTVIGTYRDHSGDLFEMDYTRVVSCVDNLNTTLASDPPSIWGMMEQIQHGHE